MQEFLFASLSTYLPFYLSAFVSVPFLVCIAKEYGGITVFDFAFWGGFAGGSVFVSVYARFHNFVVPFQEQEMGKVGKRLYCYTVLFSVVFVPLCPLQIRNTNSQKRNIGLLAMSNGLV